MISKIWGSVKKAWNWVKGWFTSSTPEKKIRAIKKKIRLTKGDLYRTQIANQQARREAKRLKGRREYIVRAAIAKYYQLHIDLIKRIDNEIKELHEGSFQHLKSIEKSLNRKVNGNPEEQNRALSLNQRLFSRMGESKAIRRQLSDSKSELIHRIKVLMDPNYPVYRNHHKLGGLTEIKNIIDDQKKYLLEEHARPQKGVEIAELVYSYTKRCRSCRSYVFEKMNYCFVCGERIQEVAQLAHFKKTNEVSCKYCNCPSSEQWQYCPNCGGEFDFAGLKEWIKKIRPRLLKK